MSATESFARPGDRPGERPGEERIWIEYRRLSDLRKLENNAKDHDIGGLHGSMNRWGYTAPITIDERTSTLAAGHGRIETLEQKRDAGENPPKRIVIDDDGEWTVPVVRGISFNSDADLRAYAIADNRHVELGGWIMENLADNLSMLAEHDELALEGTGFDADDLQQMLDDLDAQSGREEGNTDPDHVPDPPGEPVSGRGDVWLLGEHRVMCGDSTALADVEKLTLGEADAMWTDPPYGVSYVGKTKDALTISNDGEGAPALFADVLVCAEAVLKPGAPFYVAHPPGALSVRFGQAVLAHGWRIHQTLVWVKDSMVLGHADYHYKHEPMLYGYKPGSGRLGRGGDGWYGDNSQVSVFEVERPKASREHPTSKPVELIVRCLQNSTRRGDVVLEPFGGGGSTLIACEHLNRKARVMEIDPKYVDVICRRFQEFTGKLPVLESTGEAHDFTA